MRAGALPFPRVTRPLIDTCGTGGDGGGTFNISTAAAFVVAARRRCAVAKHGNRAVSTRTGSADVLEALGVSVDLTPDERRAHDRRASASRSCSRRRTTAAIKHAAGPRRELGVRTVFNVLGPALPTRPAPSASCVGVYAAALGAARWPQVLRRLGAERALGRPRPRRARRADGVRADPRGAELDGRPHRRGDGRPAGAAAWATPRPSARSAGRRRRRGTLELLTGALAGDRRGRHATSCCSTPARRWSSAGSRPTWRPGVARARATIAERAARRPSSTSSRRPRAGAA